MNRTHLQLYDRLCDDVVRAPLGSVLAGLLRLARAAGREDLLQWARLELEGYTGDNPAMNETVTVPEYRTVPGRYYDDFGRPLALDDPNLRFINEDRLRFGVPQMEKMAGQREEIRIQGTRPIDTVRSFLKVEVTSFGFSPTSVEGVLASIRARAIDEVENLAPAFESLRARSISPVPRERSWLVEHGWTVVATVAAGLLIAFLSHLFGWV